VIAAAAEQPIKAN